MRFDEVHDIIQFSFRLKRGISAHAIDDPRSWSRDEPFELDGFVLTDFGNTRGLVYFEGVLWFFLFFPAAEKHLGLI